MKFTLEIELGSDTMRTYTDIILALAKVLGTLDTGAEVCPEYASIRDAKGNRVGKWTVIE